MTVAFAAMAMIITAIAPAHATSGGDDLESVRAEVAGTFTYKIGLLADKAAGTTNPGRVDAYEAGIAELTTVRDTSVASAASVEELWNLNDLAHSIYHEAVAAADAVPATPAEELAIAKEHATNTINGKINALSKWIEGCDDPVAISIVEAGIGQLEALRPLVDAATTADDAYAVKQRAKEIYRSTMDAAENAKDTAEPKPEPEPQPEPAPEKSPEEKAAEALEKARRATVSFLEDKVTILQTAAEAEKIAAIVKVFENAAADIEALIADARSASSKGELSEVEQRATTIYQAAKEAAMAIRNSDEGDPAEALAAYLDRIVNYVTTTTADAASTAEASPDTYADLVSARDAVLDRVDRVAAVAESGDGLGQRWEDLNESLSAYRLALIRHYIALGEPLTIGGIQIPG